MLLQNDKEAKALLNLTVKMARMLLAYGAEVYRVEDTILRVCKSFDNLKAVNVLITYNFAIVSFVYDDNNYNTMRRIILGGKNLEKISNINDLSRKIVMGACSVEYAFKKLKEIKNAPQYSRHTVILALVISAPFFAVMFGGTFKDSFYACFVMCLEAIFLIFSTRYKMMIFLSNFLGAFLATVVTMILSNNFNIVHQSSIIVAAIMPLVPGVQITNSVRDFMAGDSISGMIGMQTAFFMATAIALGVIFGLKI